ncbi:MAG: GNAT family N-acetyltransferase [Kiritimatiellae bacterium]|nr:GNAT family N-acetyltransferase [Kiritimatiellia bacterium]
MNVLPSQPPGSPAMRRVVDDSDIAQVARLAREIWMRHYAPIIGAAQTNYMLDRFQSVAAIRGQLAEGYVYCLADGPEGTAGYCALLAGKDRRLLLSKLYVRDDARRRGIGRAMVAFAEQHGQALGLRELWLTVNRHKSGSIAFYERVGFSQVGTQVTDIGGGYVMDDFVMAKPLVSAWPSNHTDERVHGTR